MATLVVLALAVVAVVVVMFSVAVFFGHRTGSGPDRSKGRFFRRPRHGGRVLIRGRW